MHENLNNTNYNESQTIKKILYKILNKKYQNTWNQFVVRPFFRCTSWSEGREHPTTWCSSSRLTWARKLPLHCSCETAPLSPSLLFFYIFMAIFSDKITISTFYTFVIFLHRFTFLLLCYENVLGFLKYQHKFLFFL